MPDHQTTIFEGFAADEAESPATPIATKLRAHFMSGGSIRDGIRLVEREERASVRGACKQRVLSVRGSRLSSDWGPSTSEIAFAVDRGMTLELAHVEAEKFRNYWTAKTGVNATKRDWSATWRNWIITAMERGNGAGRIGGFAPRTFDASRRSATGSDAVLAGMGRLAHRLDERRRPTVEGGRQIPDRADVASELDPSSRSTRRD
jgi:hypothetical protein